MAQDTPEKSILEKLAQTQTFHPAGAKLFVPDWTLDPGDVVTVTSKKDVHDPDEEPTEYKVPIYSMDLTWNGTSRLDIQSTGNQEREPLSALRRKEYQTGRRGYGMAKDLDDSFKEFETWQTQTDEVIGTYAAQFVDILGDGTNEGRLTLAETAIEQTASDATITAQAAGILLDENGHPVLDERGKYQYDPNAANTTLTARINTNATNILSKVSQSDLNTTLASYLLINSFSTELASTLDNGDTTLAAKIITAVNKNTNTSSVVISADQINLDGVVTAVFLDSRMAKIDQLFTQVGYAGAIAANSASIATSLTAGSVYADSFYFKGETSGSDLQVVTKPVYLMGDGNFINGLSLLATGASDMNIRHSHAISIEAMSGADEGKIQVTLGEAVVTNSTDRIKNFNIADTAFYKKRVGISSVVPGNWQYDSTEHKYYNQVVATAKDSTQANPDTMTANVFIPDITITPVVNGLTYVGKVNAWGPSVSGTVYAAADELSLYLKEKDNYVYITKTDSDPVPVGPNSNVVARMEIQGGGSEEDYNQGYADGQTNARAEISGIILNRTYTSYSDNNLSIKISGTPKLVLLSNDDPPVETERFGQRLDVDTTMVVRTTNASLSEGAFTNGQYTITGTGGNVNVDSVDGVGGANIPVGVSPLTFTPTDALNSVNVVKGSWTGTNTRTIEFTTDAPSPNASAPKSVTLSWNNGGWVWTASDDSGNYQKQIQVKDGSSVAMTDYVDMPDTKVVVTSPGQQQASWWKTTGSNANKYVVPASTAADYLSSDSSNQHVPANGTGTQTIIDPSEAILYGKSQVSVTRTWDEYTGSTTGATPLESGKTYQLQVKKDGTNVYDELYSVPAQASPTVNTWGLTHQTGTDYTYKANVKVNGTSYESGNLNATEAYNNGWTGAYQSVGIFPTAVADLVPGGSPITIYAQAKATSGAAKTNVTSVQVKARALNLKDETFRSNDTYTVPSGYDGYGTITVDVQGGGGNRTVESLYPSTIVLNNEETETSEHVLTAYYSSGTDTTPVTVSVDATQVFNAGVTEGMGGTTVDVVKSAWQKNVATMVQTCEFYPSAGDGARQSVSISQSPSRNQSSATGTVAIKDYDETIGTVTLYLSTSGDKVVLRHLKNPIVTPTTIIAGTPIAAIDIPSGETIVSDVDHIVQIGNTEYSSDYKTATIPVQAQDSSNRELLTSDITASVEGAWEAGRTVGIREGSGLQIEENHYEVITQNNQTVSVFPTRPNNVMSSASIRVEVPVHEGVQGATLLASTDSDTAWGGWQLNDYTQLSKKYGFIKITGKDGSTYSYGIDANDVYDAGVSAGAGIQIEPTKAYGSTVTETGTYTINPSSGYAAMKKATFSVRVPSVPRIQKTLAYGTASMGNHTVYPDEDYDAMQKVTFTVPNVTVDTQRNQPTTGVTTTNIRVGNNIKVIVKFGNAIVHQQIFAATN